jgi:dUTP pyrophosphatase
MGMFYATRDGCIERHQRLVQFKIVDKQPSWNFVATEYLGNKDRSGFGSTGK